MLPILVRALSIGVVSLLLLRASPAQSAPLPPGLAALLVSARRHAIEPLELAGVRFRSIAPLYAHPRLLWLEDSEATPPFERNHASVGRWLTQVRAVFGLSRCELVYRDTTPWRGADVWNYSVVCRGLEVFDARIEVHWSGAEFVGVHAVLPGDIASIAAPPEDREAREWVYLSRNDPPRTDLELGWLEREQTERGAVLRIVDASGLRWTRITPPATLALAAPGFTEWAVPSGNFPDQIAVSVRGQVWFSQPNQDRLARFEPASSRFTFFPTGAGTTPDGLACDSRGDLWTGLYANAGLGRLDIATGVFLSTPAPYAPSALAIPLISANGKLYVTDHQNNCIAVWDPQASAWQPTVPMPTAYCWVVDGAEDVASQTQYYAQYFGNQIGKLPWGGAVTDIPTPSFAGPTFADALGGKIWISYWLEGRIASYDVSTGAFVEYVYPQSPFGEYGGPIVTRRDGKVIVGTRGGGYLMILDIASGAFTALPLPTPSAGFKDGLTVAPNGDVWFTESTAGKIGRYSF